MNTPKVAGDTLAGLVRGNRARIVEQLGEELINRIVAYDVPGVPKWLEEGILDPALAQVIRGVLPGAVDALADRADAWGEAPAGTTP